MDLKGLRVPEHSHKGGAHLVRGHAQEAVLEVVRGAQLLVGPPELRGGPLAQLVGLLGRRDVLHHRHGHGASVRRVGHQGDRDPDPDDPAVLADVALLELVLVALPAHELGKQLGIRRHVLRVGQLHEAHSHELVGRVAGELAQGGVDPLQAPVLVPAGGHSRSGPLEDPPELGGVAARRLISGEPLSHVHE